MPARPCPVLADLLAEALELWQSPEQERRRRLWADHFNGRTDEIPVSCAMFQGSQDLVWQKILPECTFVHKEGVARTVEAHLRHTLWRAQHVPDDTPHDPALRLSALPALAPDELWGVPLASESTGQAGGAYKPVPPLQDPDDIRKLRAPEFRSDGEAFARQREGVLKLVGMDLPVVATCDALHNGPFEWAVRLRGMDNLLLDVYDRPQWLKQLMAFLSESIVAYHRQREQHGLVNAPTDCALHSPWDDYDERPPSSATGFQPVQNRLAELSSCWGYLHAQSAASYGPDTYAEFVQPYNVPIARLYGKVYYHGCECLDEKAEVIRDLPHLAQFHVSPWSDPAVIGEKLPDSVCLEVHSHPTNVLLLWDAAQMREELRDLVRAAGSHPLNLKLCDIQTIDGPEALITWSRIAKEVAASAR